MCMVLTNYKDVSLEFFSSKMFPAEVFTSTCDLSHGQWSVMKVQSDWREGPLQRKEEWKFVFTSSGVLYVITRGERLMPLWCVSKWATQNSVSWFLT